MLRFRRGPKPGTIYEGPMTYCHDYALVQKPGFYALNSDGSFKQPLLRLVQIDDAPDDETDGAQHFEIAGKHDPIARQGSRVPLESQAEGAAEVAS